MKTSLTLLLTLFLLINCLGQTAEEYTNRGFAKDARQDYNGAIEDFNSAIKINPNVGELYYLRASSKNDLQDYEGAMVDLNKAIEINPNIQESYFLRGTLKSNLYDYRGAIEDFTTAIKLNPTYAVCILLQRSGQTYTQAKG